MDALTYTPTNKDLVELLQLSGELFDLRAVSELLHWDQETYMPPKGIIHRARQLSTMSTIYHQKLTRPDLGYLLEKLSTDTANHPQKYTDPDRALVREVKRARDQAVKIPEKWVQDMTQAAAEGLEAWKVARQQKKFALFQKPLEKLFSLKVEQANYLGYETSPYDALLDEYEPDLTVEKVNTMFTPLRMEITRLLKKIEKSHPPKSKLILRGQTYSKVAMVKITEKMLGKIGYDFSSGRQDFSAHPFTINFGHQDVRLTNRYIKTDLASSIFSAIHEGGHALYEMGISETLGNTFLAVGTSLGIHESQSRLWENLIGRSREFWEYWTPFLSVLLPRQVNGHAADDLFHEANRVEPGFVRVDADEVTYNLHIILRFEIERDLLEKKITVSDLPEIWNAKSKELLGITPPDDSLGILQDIHWSQGSIGYFPTYTLGNLYAAQFYRQLQVDMPQIAQHIASGNFEPIRHWLRLHIHQYGSVYRPDELVKKVTGEELKPKYFMDYLYNKYTQLYRLT